MGAERGSHYAATAALAPFVFLVVTCFSGPSQNWRSPDENHHRTLSY